MNHGVLLHLICELYKTFRNFKIHVSDYLHPRKTTSTMNGCFLDATTDELNVSDVTCIICCEETTTAKKLLCGHLFHVHCLRSWRERQNTCPTCRSPIAPRTMDVLHQRDSMKPNWELAWLLHPQRGFQQQKFKLEWKPSLRSYSVSPSCHSLLEWL
ncbi:ERAD-associated E3 ubiquitin-protein ligase HRD1-like isoform X1 [Triticum urartu]|uniref:ERAD-associated E3 ubiquitin-protein ligase HRD1-like isoform X1 n=1 Tax=Triticum urartu TaxID=4572 RepID=UPI002043DF82|nr:ERAD-associated E3 ubiquitin-protein ligase HRD1-like isoform X1 [Triticum urartu]